VALAGFRDGQERASASAWERHLLRIGPSVLLAVGGALLTLWTLLLVGGALAWLALHGYGFYLLLAAVSSGTLLGSSIALTRRRRTDRERLN
jgi:polyferredoxin